jgi:hypothetical protein
MLIEFEDRTEETAEAMLAYLDGRDPWETRRGWSVVDCLLAIVLCLAAGIQPIVTILAFIRP